MKLKDYKVGLKVTCIKSYDGNYSIVKKIGTVTAKDEDDRFGIIFDNKIEFGHTLRGHCERGYGYWIPPEHLVLANINKRIS